MAVYVIPFTVVIPAGTTAAEPYTQELALDNWSIERIDLEVPSGPAGLMGFQVYNNGVPWIPYGADEWLVWDNVKEFYYMTDQPTGSGWAIAGYNTGFYDHSVTTRWHVNPTSSLQPAPATPSITVVTSDVATGETTTL